MRALERGQSPVTRVAPASTQSPETAMMPLPTERRPVPAKASEIARVVDERRRLPPIRSDRVAPLSGGWRRLPSMPRRSSRSTRTSGSASTTTLIHPSPMKSVSSGTSTTTTCSFDASIKPPILCRMAACVKPSSRSSSSGSLKHDVGQTPPIDHPVHHHRWPRLSDPLECLAVGSSTL